MIPHAVARAVQREERERAARARCAASARCPGCSTCTSAPPSSARSVAAPAELGRAEGGDDAEQVVEAVGRGSAQHDDVVVAEVGARGDVRRAPARCRWRPCRPGARSTAMPWRVPSRGRPALTLSRSPTSSVGCRPAASATSRPLSTAITSRWRSRAAAVLRSVRCGGVGRAAPRDDDDDRAPCAIPPLALPRSGSRVGGGGHPLSPPCLRAPRSVVAPQASREPP